MSLAYLQAMAAQDIIGRIIGVYLPALAFEAIGNLFGFQPALSQPSQFMHAYMAC